MYKRLVMQDLRANWFQSACIAFFVCLSVLFLATATHLVVHLHQAIDELTTRAETPHLLQMHQGSVDIKRLEQFSATQPAIEKYQVLPFARIQNADLTLGAVSLKDVVYDNGFSTQSPQFDYLFDLNGELLAPKIGEVYVPLLYRNMGIVQIGDTLTIQDRTLRVAGFVRDSQMNSSLSTSRRFVVHSDDFTWIAEKGSIEQLIEFRLTDVKAIGQIQAAYQHAGLEHNGPPLLTLQLFQLANAFSDGVTIALLLMISALVNGIALLCIRFALLAKLEQDYPELAILKAIGLPIQRLKQLFLMKYIVLILGATVAGVSGSFILKSLFQTQMDQFFGAVSQQYQGSIFAIGSGVLVFGGLYSYLHFLAKRIERLTLHPERIHAAQPLFKSDSIHTIKLLGADLFSHWKQYATMMSVMVLALFVVVLPMTIYTTMTDKSFVYNLGVGTYDLRVDLAQTDGEQLTGDKLLLALQSDDQVVQVEQYKSKQLIARTKDEKEHLLWIDFGNHQQFPLRYINGHEPRTDDEIALSHLKADELQMTIGDSLTILDGSKPKHVRICGIYSDLSNGGKTAKATFATDDLGVVWRVFAVQLIKSELASQVIERYQAIEGTAKFANVSTYLHQVFESTLATLRQTIEVAVGAAIVLVLIIVILFVRMRYLSDRSTNAILQAIGFSHTFIYRQYIWRTSVVWFLALFVGYGLIFTVGDWIAAQFLALIGIVGVQFVRSSWIVYLVLPIGLFVVCLVAIWIGTIGMKTQQIAQWLKEEGL